MVVLNQQVLVLNRLWQAVNICTARRAFMLLYAGHAAVVEQVSGSYQTFSFTQWREASRHHRGAGCVRSISFQIRVPKVIVLMFYDRFPKKDVKLTRQAIFERDKFTCQYCGRLFDRRDLNLDHVMPRDRGGQMTWENIVCSCLPCNTRKGNRTPEEAGIKLLRKPRRPKWRPILHATVSHHCDDAWTQFLDVSRWHVELG